MVTVMFSWNSKNKSADLFYANGFSIMQQADVTTRYVTLEGTSKFLLLLSLILFDWTIHKIFPGL